MDWFPAGSFGRGFERTTTDANGAYGFEGLVTEPERGFFVEAFTDNAFGGGGGVTPTLANTGSTVTVDILACTDEEVATSCPVANWSLSGDEITLSPVDGQCNTFEVDQVLTVLDFENGVLTLSTPTRRGGGVLEIGRVQGFGPSVLNASSILGVYKQTGVDLFALFGANGLFGFMQSDINDGFNVQFEAGTYTFSGSTLSITPLYDSEGTPGPGGSGTATVNATTFTVTFEGDTEVFTRCADTSGTSLPGMWIRLEEGLVSSLLLIGTAEYASASFETPLPREAVSAWAQTWRGVGR